MSDILEVKNISVAFDGFKAINNLSFSIGAREMRAIIGPNGAGKTTFMDIITGKTKPDSGDVIWGERNISLLRKSESQIAQLGVGTFFFALTYDYNEQEKMRVAEIAELVNLDVSHDKKAGDLSHGQKQWLEIGMLLAQDPMLLLIDEPAAGMTSSERLSTVKLLKDMAKTRSVIVVEHDMDFVRNLNCGVTVLHEGSVLAEGHLDHISKNKDVIEVYLGR